MTDKRKIPDILKPYLEHPLVKNKNISDLEALDNPQLNNAIRVEDQIIRGIREYYLDDAKRTSGRLTPGQFSSSILLARGLAFIDIAHYKTDVSDICNDIWEITPTTAKRAYFNQNMSDSVIPRLDKGLVVFDAKKQQVIDRIPYPVGSKLFVQKNLIENTTLYEQQANHYEIIGGVQNFPELRTNLEKIITSKNPRLKSNFNRDYDALSDIDVIRTQEINGRSFTFSKDFLTGAKSNNLWLQVLDSTSDQTRIALKSLMDFLGDSGGFVTHNELVKATGQNERRINNLLRSIDNLGIAKRVTTLEMKDALSRITTGTLINMNYRELDNAGQILSLSRELPVTADILNMLNKGTVNEDDLTNKYPTGSVQIIRNYLCKIGLINKAKIYTDGDLELVPFKGNHEFISNVLTECAHSRKVLPPDYDYTNRIKDQFDKVDDERMSKGIKQMKLDFFENVDEEYKK